MEEKLIIFAALGYPQKANSALPAIPATWEEVVESAVAACKAGASIVHLHGPVDREGRTIPDGWVRLTEDIRSQCDALIDFGRASSPLEERKTLLRLGTGKPDLMGICLSEHDYLSLRGIQDVKFVHTRSELEEYARCCLETGVKPCWEVWHLGGIWNFNYLAAQGLVAKPYWLELFFGTEGGTWSPPTVEEINQRIANLPADSV